MTIQATLKSATFTPCDASPFCLEQGQQMACFSCRTNALS